MHLNSSDRISALVEKRLDRRATIKAGAAAVAALTVSGGAPGVSAQDATPVDPLAPDESSPMFLFVQLADAGTWMPKPGEEGVYLLTLAGLGDQTLYFSDRPERIVGTVPTDRFLDSLGFTPIDPPNAAIVVQDADGQRDVLVVELMNPVYTQDFAGLGDNSLVYEAKILENYQGEGLEYWEQQQVDEKLAEGFSNVSVFIDECPGSDYCYRPSTFTCDGVGPIPGGAIGNCWDKDSWICLPCSHSLGYYYDLCNQAYPAACQGQCVISNPSLMTC